MGFYILATVLRFSAVYHEILSHIWNERHFLHLGPLNHRLISPGMLRMKSEWGSNKTNGILFSSWNYNLNPWQPLHPRVNKLWSKSKKQRAWGPKLCVYQLPGNRRKHRSIEELLLWFVLCTISQILRLPAFPSGLERWNLGYFINHRGNCKDTHTCPCLILYQILIAAKESGLKS